MNVRRAIAAAATAATAFALPAVPAAAGLGYCAPQPKPTVYIGNDWAYEDEAAKLKVSLSGTFCSNVTVDYQTQHGTAGAWDYVSKAGQVVFTPGQTTQFITVVIKMDAIADGGEYFWVKLSNHVNGAIGDSWGKVTIVDGPGPEG